ncbi:hypothetical protein ACFWN2_08260 [Lentzea sp. NPDC058436]|uniref:hypothetical protein n=1 Tax=Lentzea sp. NPDC058436 TaxID=3346499 RepID=UPI003666AE62
MTTTDRAAFVHALDIGVVHPKLARPRMANEVTPQGPTAAIDAGSLMSFTSDVSAVHRSDALNSTLIAQLNSDKLFNRFDPAQLIPWYQNYTTVLSHLGWDIQQFSFERYQASGSTMSVSTAVLGVLGAVLPAGELALVAAALKALAALKSNDPWYQVWDVTTHDQSNGNFQISNCVDHDGDGNTLVMRLSGYSLHTTDTTVRFLWNDYQTSSTDLMFASQACTLDEDVYSQVRAAVIKKLGDKAVQYVGNLDI